MNAGFVYRIPQLRKLACNGGSLLANFHSNIGNILLWRLAPSAT